MLKLDSLGFRDINILLVLKLFFEDIILHKKTTTTVKQRHKGRLILKHNETQLLVIIH